MGASSSFPRGVVKHLQGSWTLVSEIFSGLEISTFQTKPGNAPNRGVSVALGGTRLWCTSREAPTVTCARIPASHLVLVIPLNRPCQHVVNSRKLESNTIVLCEPRSAYISRSAPGKKSYVLAFPVERVLQGFAARSGADAPRFTGECKALQPQPHALQALERTVRTIAECARNTPELIRSPSAVSAIERSLLVAAVRLLASAEIGPTPHTRLAASVTSICESANAYLREHQGKPIYIADVCAALGVSERNLDSAFRKGIGIAPIAYLRLRRLHHAREQLKASSAGAASVKAVAYEAGFSDLGRFAGYYRRVFGEAPHETLDRDSIPGRCFAKKKARPATPYPGDRRSATEGLQPPLEDRLCRSQGLFRICRPRR